MFGDVASGALPVGRTSADESVAQILTSAAILASVPVAMAVFQGACLALPAVSAVAFEVGYAICAAAVVEAWVLAAVVRICK